MQHVVNNNGIRQGFANLAQIFAPNANQMIQADLARGRRDLMNSQQRNFDATASATAADTARRDQVHGNLMGLGQSLAGLDLTDQAGRAALIGILGGAGLDLQHPDAVAGHGVFLNPQFTTPDNFANIFLGTGAVNSYDQTQPGQAQSEDAARALALTERALINEGAARVQGLKNEGAVEQLEFKRDNPSVATSSSVRPVTVDPTDSRALEEALRVQLATTYPDIEIPDVVVQQLLPQVSTVYQSTRNAPAAVAEVLRSAQLAIEQHEGVMWPGPSQRLTMQPPGAAATPAAPETQAQEGQTATGPNGQKIILRGGQWVPLQ